MKSIFLIISILTFSAFSASAQKAGGAKVDPAKGVKDAFERLTEGIRQVDADKVMAAYDKSEKLLIFNNNGTATLGWNNLKANVDATYAKITNVTLEITGLRVELMGTGAAYVTCKWKQTQENDHKLEDASGRMTLLYKLIGKEWKIVHRHTSPDNPAATRPVFPSERTTN